MNGIQDEDEDVDVPSLPNTAIHVNSCDLITSSNSNTVDRDDSILGSVSNVTEVEVGENTSLSEEVGFVYN